METTIQKKERLKLTPDQMFDVYVETSHANSPVKNILERYGIKPWELVEIRKKVRTGAIQSLSMKGKPGRPMQGVPVEEYNKLGRQLQEAKDAVVAVGHELALLKKRTS